MELVRAQGATEYLVLLAVVLIVALVSVALLGFFPGMASDAQITQSQAYWQSSQPISIVESGARVLKSNEVNYLYFRFKNSGAYPLRITGIVGADGGKITQFTADNCVPVTGYVNISDYFYFAPGEERHLAASLLFGTACDWQMTASTGASSGRQVGGASSICQNSTASPGTLDYKTLGFEYIEYIDGQQITKRQIGKDFIVKCMTPY
jgi:hypothetical protein